MIDTIYARYARSRRTPLDKDYKPENSIRKKLHFGPATSESLAVIFPGWHTHSFPVINLAKRLAKKGWRVVVYDFHDQILEPDEDIVVDSFRYIQREIVGELQTLMESKEINQMHMIGISLGNVPMALVADKFSNFQGVTIVVGGDDLAIDMWYGLRTVDYQKAFQKMHLGIRKLDKEWYDLAPANHLRHFAGKPVLFVMSMTDKFIRTKYQRRLADKIREAGGEIKIKTSRFGHIMTIVRFCLLGPLP